MFVWTAFFLFVSAVSCGAPEETGAFVRSTGKDDGGNYRFSVDYGDSLCRYSLYFYTVIDASTDDFDAMPRIIPLEVEAISPSGRLYGETVGIDKDSCMRRSSYSRQYESLYRNGFVPVEYGQWTFRVKVIGEERFPGLRGLGLKSVPVPVEGS